MKRLNGFTLIELIIVVAIIGILAMVAIPAYIGFQTRAVRSEAFTNLETLRLLEEQFFAELAAYTPDLGAAGNSISIRDNNLGEIQNFLPGFTPGLSTAFSYRIIQDELIDGTSSIPCFHAVAIGVEGMKVEDEVYRIDCKNNKNF